MKNFRKEHDNPSEVLDKLFPFFSNEVNMHRFLLASILVLNIGSSYAITNDDLVTNSWMLEDKNIASCEIPPLIKFGKDGKLTAEPGCNNLFGPYQIKEDGAVDFSNLGMTRKLCAREYMDQEQKFVDLLNATRYIDKKEGKLILMNEKREQIGVLVPEKAGACD